MVGFKFMIAVLVALSFLWKVTCYHNPSYLACYVQVSCPLGFTHHMPIPCLSLECMLWLCSSGVTDPYNVVILLKTTQAPSPPQKEWANTYMHNSHNHTNNAHQAYNVHGGAKAKQPNHHGNVAIACSQVKCRDALILQCNVKVVKRFDSA